MKKRGEFLKNKKAQTTMFVIIALLLAIGIAAYFFLSSRGIVSPLTKTSLPAPEQYIKACSENAILEVTDKIIKTGGYYEPEGKIFYVTHNEEKVPFLCYTRNYYESCIMQQPALKKHVEKEIQANIKKSVEDCYDKLKEDYERKGYSVQFPEGNNPNINLKLNPGEILEDINNKITLKKGEETLMFETIKLRINHPIYELLEIALQIIECEKNDFCDAPAWAQGYGLYNPSRQFNSFLLDTEKEGLYGARIYEVIDRQTNKKFVFGVRGGVWPAGFL
jgi:hypothetical protein